MNSKKITENILTILIGITAIVLVVALCGCSKRKPTSPPSFQDFDMVKVKLSGKEGQIVNNTYKFDYAKNSWKVKVKMQRDFSIGKTSVELGTTEKVFYEQELVTINETNSPP